MPPHGRRRDDRQPPTRACPPAGTPALEHTPHTSQADHVGAAEHRFFPVFQHAPRGVGVQDLRPLRGRPSGPILDLDTYPGAPNNPTKKIKQQGTAG
jgi:hypothetical protein